MMFAAASLVFVYKLSGNLSISIISNGLSSSAPSRSSTLKNVFRAHSLVDYSSSISLTKYSSVG